MKDALLGFIVALILGSMWNGFQQDSQASGGDAGAGGDAFQGAGIPLSSVNDSSFQAEVLDQAQPVLVDFYTQNCPHCRNMAPVLGQLAQQYSGTLKVVKVDIMDNPVLANKYDIKGVPAFLLFDKGKPVETVVGETSKAKLLSKIKPYLSSPEPAAENSAGTT